MKWGIGIVALIIAGAAYYFWTQSHFDAKSNKPADTQIQAKVEVETKKQPEKFIPPEAVMEDGTI